MRIAKVCAVVAFVLAAVLAALVINGQVIALAIALIPLFAGVGILRGRAWSAYGFSLYLLLQLLMMPIVLSRSGATVSPTTAGGVALFLALCLLFFLAGRELQAANAKSGHAAPWIAIALLCSVPFILLQAFAITTGAMEPTLLVGDRILVK